MTAILRGWKVVVVLAATLGGAAPGHADPLSVGSRLPAIELEDQHGEKHAIDAGVRVVLFSRDMDGGRVIREALERGGATLLETSSAVYVADVSGMPGLVRRLIAKPRMRRRPYPMLLDEDGSATADLPSREGRATLIFLDRLVIESIAYLDVPDAVRAALRGSQDED